jgi:hypothetical protein
LLSWRYLGYELKGSDNLDGKVLQFLALLQQYIITRAKIPIRYNVIDRYPPSGFGFNNALLP